MERIDYLALAFADIRDPLLPLWAMESLAQIFFYGWLFALGATVGSFLNVVVYRFPRGKNLAFPGSYCPRCVTPIRLSDNIPIVSWFALRGRCRVCHLPIAPRYVLVELLVATTFLTVLLAEYFLPSGAFLAPHRRPLTTYDGLPFWVMYGVHVIFVTTTIGAILIAADGFTVSSRLFAPAALVAFLAPLIWPAIRSVPAVAGAGNLPQWQQGLLDGLLGLAAGGLVGFAMLAAFYWFLRVPPSAATVPLSATLGLILGWQRTIWLAPLTLLVVEGLALSLHALSHSTPLSPSTPTPPSTAGYDPLPLLATPPPPETIQEEIHIVPAPSEPTEPS